MGDTKIIELILGLSIIIWGVCCWNNSNPKDYSD